MNIKMIPRIDQVGRHPRSIGTRLDARAWREFAPVRSDVNAAVAAIEDSARRSR